MRALIVAVALFCTGCAHNLPLVDYPNLSSEAARVRVYVDANGTFYPDGWRQPTVVGLDALKKHHSILAAIHNSATGTADQRRAEEKGKRAVVMAQQAARLDDIRRLAIGKTRVFIFMVGFNADHKNSAFDITAMQDQIRFSATDLIIEFYWDGQSASAAKVDAAKIWFSASGYSKVAGQHALRSVLNQVPDQEVTIVSYSRGAAVVLSAMSDPSYDDDFVSKTKDLSFLQDPEGGTRVDFFQPAPLAGSGPIRAILLAGAIGEIDFEPYERRGCDALPAACYRPLPRVRSIRFSVNRNDPVLSKARTGLAKKLNPTSLGSYLSASCGARRHYAGILQAYPVVTTFGHDAQGYLEDPSFVEMLADSGIQPRARPPLTEGETLSPKAIASPDDCL